MVTAASIESMIVLDCGSTTTRAVLVDLVDGHYRFIARGETSMYQVTTRCVAQRGGEKPAPNLKPSRGGLSERPRTTDRAGTRRGEGVDALLVVADFKPSLRVILAGLSDHISLASARRAIRAAHAQIAYVICPRVIGDATQTEETRLSLISALTLMPSS